MASEPETLLLLSITRLIAILFLPLYPAMFVMNRLPKTEAHTEGPLSGMKIKLTGGGAFYFVLVVTGFSVLPAPKIPQINTQGDAWLVKGSVSMKPLKEGDDPPEALKVVTLTCKPTWQDTGNGGFVVTVARVNVGGVPLWPKLIFTADKYTTAIIPTDDATKVEVDTEHRVLNLKNPVELLPAHSAATVKTVAAQEVPLEPTTK